MIPVHLTPEDLAQIRYVAGTCDGPFDRAIGNLIRSLVNDIEQWQNAAADIWDEGNRAGFSVGADIGRDGWTDEDDTNPYERIEHT